jgi:catechol 2,3-dioxygenase-like lactoylglutathione lyase family enzyme
MTLRRELDHQKTANLRHLLHEMEERPQVMTRRRYRALWPEADRHHRVWGPDRDFERHQIMRVPDDPERDHIAAEEFRSDREQLIAQTEVVREFVERTFAHRSPDKPATVTLKQVHDAVDAIVEMFKKYYALFTASSLATHRPIAQYDTHECFTFPWWIPEWNAWSDLARDPHHVTVFVADLARAVDWYAGVLMLKVERRGEADADLVRRRSEGGSVRIRLVGASGWKPVADVPVLSFHVDPKKFVERYRNWHGFVRDDAERWWMPDSEGNVIEFLKHLPPADPAESEDGS